jgi:hypothetical protein
LFCNIQEIGKGQKVRSESPQNDGEQEQASHSAELPAMK